MIERVIVAGLGATRLVRAWKYEEIGEAPREAALGWLAKPVTAPGGSRVNVRATKAKEWAGDLLDCPHCFGFWLTVVCVVMLRFRSSRWLVEALAGAALLSAVVQWYPGFDFEEPDPADPITVRVEP